MVTLIGRKVSIKGGRLSADGLMPEGGREKTIAYQIFRAHDKSKDPANLRLSFDALMSHDITYVGIVQTARASGLKEFPVPYVLTNCHNSLCAVGGTINEDDHAFGLSAAIKYGGIYVPANLSVIHQYAREELAFCGGMILGSDSHTRYGSYGCMGVGEGGGELVKQLLKNTWDTPAPEVVLVWLEGAPQKGVGPHDVAIALCGAVFKNGFVKNKVLEFAGPGLKGLDADYRIGIEVMTTETSCLTSIWETDDEIKKYYETVGRPNAYKPLKAGDGACYDSAVVIDLSKVECMAALPFHPSNAVTLRELTADPVPFLKAVEDECRRITGGKAELSLSEKITDGKLRVEQGEIVGCSGGTYADLVEAAAILDGASIGSGYFDLSVYPASAPISLAITRDGTAAKLMAAGAVMKPCFCGPCFGAGDTPAHNTLSIRHATRNFPNREGSKPTQGQISAVMLMDARSIAATAKNGGVVTAATDIDYDVPEISYTYDNSIYKKRVFNGFGKARPDYELRLGPNITDWPKMFPLGKNMLMKLAAVIFDDVTTTDELIPSGETSSYRSNPLKLSEFALSRRVPDYVPRSKAVQAEDLKRRAGECPPEVLDALAAVSEDPAETAKDTDFISCVFAKKPGDGSAREQAASCQKVLGGGANICYEYATKRYRSNCINWGIVPFTIDKEVDFTYSEGDYIFVPGVRDAVLSGKTKLPATVITGRGAEPITLRLHALTGEEKEILANGCLMNWYAEKAKGAN